MGQVSAAGAYARADNLAVTIPVRPADVVRPRFQVADKAPPRADAEALSPDAQADEDRSAGEPLSGRDGGGFGLLGAFTAFLTRMLALGDTEAAAPTRSPEAGSQAYARNAGVLADDQAAEVLMPGFPRLSSGRALDLIV